MSENISSTDYLGRPLRYRNVPFDDFLKQLAEEKGSSTTTTTTTINPSTLTTRGVESSIEEEEDIEK